MTARLRSAQTCNYWLTGLDQGGDYNFHVPLELQTASGLWPISPLLTAVTEAERASLYSLAEGDVLRSWAFRAARACLLVCGVGDVIDVIHQSSWSAACLTVSAWTMMGSGTPAGPKVTRQPSWWRPISQPTPTPSPGQPAARTISPAFWSKWKEHLTNACPNAIKYSII